MAYAMVPQFGNQPQGKNGRVRPDVFSNFMSNLPRPSGGGISMSAPSPTTGGAGEQIDDRLATPTRVTARRSNGNMTMSGPSPAVNLNPGNPTQFYQAGNKANAMRESADYLEHLPSSIQHAGGYSHLMAPGINQEQNKDAGSSMVAPDVMNWRSQHAKYLRNQADMLEALFMYQPQQTDPKVQVADIRAQGQLGTTQLRTDAQQNIAQGKDATNQGIAAGRDASRERIAGGSLTERSRHDQAMEQGNANELNTKKDIADQTNRTRAATTQQATQDRSDDRRQRSNASEAVTAREEMREAAQGGATYQSILGGVQNHKDWQKKSPEEQAMEAHRIFTIIKNKMGRGSAGGAIGTGEASKIMTDFKADPNALVSRSTDPPAVNSVLVIRGGGGGTMQPMGETVSPGETIYDQQGRPHKMVNGKPVPIQ